MPLLTAENSHFLLSGSQEAALVMSHYTTVKPSVHVKNHYLIWWQNRIDTQKTFPQDYDYELLNLSKTKIPITIVKAQMPSNPNQKSRMRDNKIQIFIRKMKDAFPNCILRIEIIWNLWQNLYNSQSNHVPLQNFQHGHSWHDHNFPSKFCGFKVWFAVSFYSKLVPVNVCWYCICYIKICFYCVILYLEYRENSSMVVLKSYEAVTAMVCRTGGATCQWAIISGLLGRRMKSFSSKWFARLAIACDIYPRVSNICKWCFVPLVLSQLVSTLGQ